MGNHTMQPNDIDNPEWQQTFHVDGAQTFDHENHGAAGILTIHGVMDLMHHLKEETAEELQRWMDEGEHEDQLPGWLRQVLPRPEPKPVSTITDINAARSFRTDTYVIPVAGLGLTGGATLISQRSDRVRAVVYNVGANPAFLSYSDDVTNLNTAGETGWVILPNGAAGVNPREFRAGGKIYCYSPLGTQVDIYEEYGYRNREGGMINP